MKNKSIINKSISRFSQSKVLWRGRSNRERFLILLGMTSISIILFGQIVWLPISAAFTQQEVRLQEAERDLQNLPDVIERYLKLRARKTQLEKEYKNLEVKDGNEVSYLEKLLKKDPEIGNDFDIKERGDQKNAIGNEYAEIPFTVTLHTKSLESIVKFMTDVSYGEQPMIITNIDMERNPTTAYFTGVLSISSIRREK